MLDFTSALYLGLSHGAATLAPWEALTRGTPAILDEDPRSGEVATAAANLAGLGAGVLYTSTLHLFWDVVCKLAPPPTCIFKDAGTYAIASWGIERAAARGARVLRFRHHDAGHLEEVMATSARSAGSALVVCDGFCSGCGQPAPLAAYRELARARRGLILVDDTQAFGVLGRGATPHRLGRGGGGSLRVGGHDCCREVVYAASLAKAFGAPVALLAGTADTIERLTRHSETRLHCSPPNAAALAAAARALEVNARWGDDLRARLEQSVSRLRAGLVDLGISTRGWTGPVQEVAWGRASAPLAAALTRAGVKGIERRRCDGTRSLALVVTARHPLSEIDQALAVIGRSSRRPRAGASPIRIARRAAQAASS